MRLGPFQVRQNCCDVPLKLAAFFVAHVRRVEFGAEIGLELRGTVAEHDAADAPVGRGHE